MRLPVFKGCGECTVCCTLYGVLELGKPYYTPCEHIGGKGCKIYGHHPESCQEYSCLWNVNLMGGIEDRPDKCGTMLGVSPMGDALWIEIMEVWPQDMQQTIRKYEHIIKRELARKDVSPSLYGLLYIRHGAVPGIDFKAKEPYLSARYLEGAGNNFHRIWGSPYNIALFCGNGHDLAKYRDGIVSEHSILNDNLPWNKICQWFNYGEPSTVEICANAIDRHLITPLQRQLLKQHNLELANILKAKISSNNSIDSILRAMFADWNDRLGFTAFFR